jgi:hypothetical protein
MRCSRVGTKLLKFARAAIFRPDMINSGDGAAARGWYARRARAISTTARQLARPGVPAALGGTDSKPVWAGHMAGLSRRPRGTRR